MKKSLILLFITAFCIQSVMGQVQISGKVVDDQKAGLPGVSVIIKGTSKGTATDIDGNYALSASSADTLVFSMVGMATQKFGVGSSTSINVTLLPATNVMDEVVVVGYGTQKVKDLTSAIATIKPAEIAKVPTGQAMQALQGKVAGLQVVSNGSPGNSPTIRVRGIGSYPGQDNEAPLYVVDGMFFDNIDFLNTADIESISVLKDASAAAIYGVRAANGVILIETKSGKYNQKSEISYDGYYGTQIAQNVLKMANAEQFTTMAMESGSTADQSYILNAMQRYGRSRVNPNVPNVNTDWYKEILRPAQIQNHSFNVSGGNQQAAYSIGTNYFSQEGILNMNNKYERFNLRTKVDFMASKWLTVGGSMILSNSLKNGEEAGAWNLAYFAVPILPVFDPLNTLATPIDYANAQDLGYRSGQNPFPTLKYNNNRLKSSNMLANYYAKIDFIPNKLSFKTSYNFAYTGLDERNVQLPYYIGNSFQRPDAQIVKITKTYSDQIWDNVMTFNNKFGRNYVVVMAGTSFRDEAYNNLHATGLNFPYQHQESWYINQSATKPSDQVGDDGTRQYGFSYFGRLSYNFADKYLFYATMRADGSSKYQQTWGYFPTVGAGWVISEEPFLKDNQVVNYLKLRAGWGQLGNDKIQASDGAITTNVVTTAVNGVLVSGTQTTNTFSSLKWEVTEETNVGLTSRLLKNRLSIDADYFVRDTKNAAIAVTIPGTGGSVLKNVGIIRNSGIEVALNWNQEISKSMSYNIGFNFATLKNEVRDLYGQPYIDGGSAEFRQRSKVGEPLLAFYGYEVLGVYQNQAQIAADPAAPAGAVPGDFIYKDQQKEGQTGHGVINDDDRVILGSYFPKFTFGGNVGFNWKNLDFSANILGQTGNKILNRKRGEIIWTSDQNMDADLATNRWHGEGTSNKYPSSAGLRKGWNQKMSTYFVEDGSFFRIQNVQVAYNIKGKQFLGAYMPETRVSFTAERPLTFFKYNGFNPEVANGIDTQTYPIPAVYTVGLSIKF